MILKAQHNRIGSKKMTKQYREEILVEIGTKYNKIKRYK